MNELKTIRLDGNGIAWNGPFTSVILTSLSGNEKGKELEENFKELAGTKERVNFFVAFPEDAEGKEQTWEGTGVVDSFEDDGDEVRVFFKLESNVTMHIKRKVYR
ncbi:MAG: hypothetical protein C0473_04230 [Cyanobacteria bacterium DS3.002]|nr:hypothetical protein [Cyanobacteria bacterium DS3.002]MBA4076973.1 hypothetical protein [Cyanobacteria bacterium PR.023]